MFERIYANDGSDQAFHARSLALDMAKKAALRFTWSPSKSSTPVA
jgi:hypothetical protein